MPHKRIRDHGSTAPILAAFEALEPEEQEVIRREVTIRLRAQSAERDSHSTRRAAAVRAVNEAADIIGAPPSVGQFEAIRDEHPEYDWPPTRSIKRWLSAGSWIDALLEPASKRRPITTSAPLNSVRRTHPRRR